MVQGYSRQLSFGPYRLLPERQLLLLDGAQVRAGPRAIKILTALAERPGEIISKRELMERAWPDIIVDEGNLKVNIGAIRRVLDDPPQDPRYIATVTGRGYRFISNVETESVSDRQEAVAPAAPSGNVPILSNRVIGRSEFVGELRSDFASHRLVTVVGPGGVGKTTIAVIYSEIVKGDFEDGLWFVDLSRVREEADVASTVAAALGLAVHSADVASAICGHLRDKNAFLILDSCEPVLGPIGTLADLIVARCGNVRILATSREPLRIKAERVRRIAGLESPPQPVGGDAARALSYPAVELFSERAKDSDEGFALTDDDAPIVSEICRKLDGLALAIEFAASRLQAFGARGLLAVLADRLELLSGGEARPERHRTLTAMLDWSYGLLSEEEAASLRAVAAFAGRFGIEDASGVTDIDGQAMVTILSQLATKSLLSIEVEVDHVAYRLLDTTRAYGVERLKAEAEYERIRNRHAIHVGAKLARASAEWLDRPTGEWADHYAGMLDDLRVALEWASSAGSDGELVRLADAGSVLWNHFSLTEELRRYTSNAVDRLEVSGYSGTPVEMRLRLALAGATMYTRSFIPEVLRDLRAALAIAEAAADTDYRLRCLRMIGVYELFTGEHLAGLHTLDLAKALAVEADPDAVPDFETHIGCGEVFLGKISDAHRRLSRLYERNLQQSGDARFLRFLYSRNSDIGNSLSHAQWLGGNISEGLTTSEETIGQAVKSGHELSISNAYAFGCLLRYWNGEFELCGRYVDRLLRLCDQHGITAWRPVALLLRGATSGDVREGLATVRQAVQDLRAIRHGARMPYYVALEADALTRAGQFHAADVKILEALSAVEHQSEQWCYPEIVRLRAAICAQTHREVEAEALLREAISASERLGTPTWQLPAASDLAKLLHETGRSREIGPLIEPICRSFETETANPHLRRCRDLLLKSA